MLTSCFSPQRCRARMPTSSSTRLNTDRKRTRIQSHGSDNSSSSPYSHYSTTLLSLSPPTSNYPFASLPSEVALSFWANMLASWPPTPTSWSTSSSWQPSSQISSGLQFSICRASEHFRLFAKSMSIPSILAKYLGWRLLCLDFLLFLAMRLHMAVLGICLFGLT